MKNSEQLRYILDILQLMGVDIPILLFIDFGRFRRPLGSTSCGSQGAGHNELLAPTESPSLWLTSPRSSGSLILEGVLRMA
jgi:hypothetical protein